MRLRNGDHGYGAVTTTLHWLTVALLAAQVAVGYTMDADPDVEEADCDPPGEDRSGGDTSPAEEERLDRLEDRCEAEQERLEADLEGAYPAFDGTVDLLDLHVLLGVAIIVVALARVLWRATTPLPPWSPRLTELDRMLLSRVERVLLALLLLAPATGIALVLGGDDLLGLHIAAHLLLYAAVAVHVWIVVRRRVVGRMLGPLRAPRRRLRPRP